MEVIMKKILIFLSVMVTTLVYSTDLPSNNESEPKVPHVFHGI